MYGILGQSHYQNEVRNCLEIKKLPLFTFQCVHFISVSVSNSLIFKYFYNRNFGISAFNK